MVVATSSPASVVLNNALYQFFPCNTDDVCWSTLTPGNAWSPIQNIQATSVGWPGFHIAANTAPSPVVYGGKIYLFFSGAGRDGIWLTTSTGSGWSQVTSINSLIGSNNNNFPDGTSPSATTYGTDIYLSWTDRNSRTVQYTTSRDGTSWSAPKGIQ